MGDWNTITKEQFDAASNKHLPNNWVKASFRYFSTNTVSKDMFVRNIVKGTLIGLFLIGLIGTILSLPRILIGVATLTFTGILVALGVFMGGGAIMNNLRIRKIRKELGVNSDEYAALVAKYYS